MTLRNDMVDSNDEETLGIWPSVHHSSRTICLDHAILLSRVLISWKEGFRGSPLPAVAMKYASNALQFITTALDQPHTITNRIEAQQSQTALIDFLAATNDSFNSPANASPLLDDIPTGLVPLTGGFVEEVSPRSIHQLSGAVRHAAPPVSFPAPFAEATSRGTQESQTRQPNDISTQSFEGAGIFNSRDPGYDPIFLPKERQLLGLPPKGR